MSESDLQALESAAQGDGSEQAPITKRLLRGLLAQMKAQQKSERGKAMIDRKYGIAI